MTTTNQTQANGTSKYTHKAIVGGETVLFAFDGTDAWKDALAVLVRQHGGAVPRIEPIATDEDRAPDSGTRAFDAMDREMPAPRPTPVPAAPPIVRGSTVDAAGAARSAADDALARSAGFAPKQPLYTRGTMVVDMGVENAREKRAEFDAMPTTHEGCDDLIETVRAEDRSDMAVAISQLRMREGGTLTTLGTKHDRGLDCAVGRDALSDLMVRMGPSGGSYLAKCPAKLRAINVNHWAVEIGERDEQARVASLELASRQKKASSWEPTTAVLRTRRNEHLPIREVFGVVSEGYTAFDVDKIAAALKIAAPADARGCVKYDGTRASFDVLFHSNVRPEDYVAGEFFRAGVRVKTDDTGGGGIRVSALVWQNLCLNLLIVDRAEQRVASLRHVGGVEELARKFRASFADALDKIEGFRRAWGYAVEDDVLAAARKAHGDYVPMKVSEALPGLFTAIVERELVPVRGSKPEAVRRLIEAYSKDDSAAVRLPDGGRREYLSRAAVVNAFTRYAHEAPQPDVFAADEIERAAGALLYPVGRRSTLDALPYSEPRG